MDGRLGAGAAALAYVGALVALAVLDGVWLGLVAKGMYQREMGALMAPEVRVWTAVLFYLLYPLAVVFLCVNGTASLGEAALRGAVLGAAAYGAYNLTNASIVRDWPMSLTWMDWAWGTVVTAASAAGGWWAASFRSG